MSERDPQETTDEQVSRLLAAAAETGPMPAAVAARLDGVLADLVASRDASAADEPGTDPATDPVDLASRRRRRTWTRLLVAAAAVSVVGLGIGNLDGLTGAGSEQASSDSAAGASQAEDEAVSPESTGAEGPEVLRDDTQDDARMQADPYPSLESGPRLTTSSLVTDLQRVEDFSLAVPVDEGAEQWATMCVQPARSPGDEWLPVHLDGEPGVLVLRAPSGGRRTADIFTCEDAEVPAVSTEVDAAR